MDEISIKIYDKFGIILRIECTCNNILQFRHVREVKHKDGTATQEKAPMKKSIYSLYVLSGILKAANRRYLEFISTFDDPGDVLKKLNKISKTVEKDNRIQPV
jgi:hypothetical protein